MESTFGTVKTENEKLQAYYGALQPLTAWVKGKDVLCVETQMEKDLDDNVLNETIHLYNKFLEAATGFTSKERIKRAKKKAEK